MRYLKIVAVIVAFIFIFSTGVKLGRHVEKAKQQKATDALKIELNQTLNEAIAKNKKYKQKAIELEQALKIKPKKVIQYVEKIKKSSDCKYLGDHWRVMHNDAAERFRSFTKSDQTIF